MFADIIGGRGAWMVVLLCVCDSGASFHCVLYRICRGTTLVSLHEVQIRLVFDSFRLK